ncbi:phosphopyruvate hydratase, partial [bacterium]|nr:phosphopyruvate hydratase [bacterium]
MQVQSLQAQEILDSRGNPTVMTTLTLADGRQVSAAVPSGASTGTHEAVELRDGDQNRYAGKGVLQAVNHVNQDIAPLIVGHDPSEQRALDEATIAADGTPNKANFGANAILSVSMCLTKAAALAAGVPLYEYIARLCGQPTDTYVLPVPMCNVLNGGKHAIKSSDMQEYMLMPVGAPNFAEAVRFAAQTFHALGKLLSERGFATTVGDEGGYAPSLGDNEQPLQLMVAAIEAAGFVPGRDIALAMDPAASEFYHDGAYHLTSENAVLTTAQMIDKYADWLDKYPLVSIEDGLSEDDWDGFVAKTARLGDRLQIVGDDLFVTNPARLQKGIDLHAANSILIKLIQIGTVS